MNLLKKQVRQPTRPIVTRALPPDAWVERQFEGLALSGITAPNPKGTYDFVSCWQPILAAHVARIDAMPDLTDKQREERMLANVRGLRALKETWKNR